ncbi:MAG: AbrB/MazE/SpoVT family DNA-binding domain-containing protein [bacterium]|nr:AbrB/MazE/SpoVT family DNA-binding domain-containing protein [bacterium]
MYTVSITSQGQMSIPMPLRRMLGLDIKTKALVFAEGKRLIIEPSPDLLDLTGSLKSYAFKGKTADEIMKLEKKGLEEARLERAGNKMRRSKGGIIVVKP